jgi:hypothetical protein
LVTVNVELKDAAPVIVTASSSVVVPPLESMVKFPVDVSISLSPAIPILILSIVAPPFASNKPLTVAWLETVRFVNAPAEDPGIATQPDPSKNWNTLSEIL